MMYDDPIVDEVRRTRERLAAEFDFDTAAIFEDLRKRQAKLETRLVRRQRKRRDGQAGGPDQKPATFHFGR